MEYSGEKEKLSGSGAYSYIEEHLNEGEVIEFASKPAFLPDISKGVFFFTYLIVFLILLCIIPIIIVFPIIYGGVLGWIVWLIIFTAVLFVLPAVIAVIVWFFKFIGFIIRWSSSIFVATDQRIITRGGRMNRVFLDASYDQLVDTDVTQTAAQRLFHCGTLHIKTAHKVPGATKLVSSGGTVYFGGARAKTLVSTNEHTWLNVKKPMKAKKFLDAKIKKHKSKLPPPPPPEDGEEIPPPPPPPPPKKRTKCPKCGAPIPKGKQNLDHCEYCGMVY